MRDLLDQIDQASASQVYFLALMGALTVPDIAGALGTPSGEASAKAYENWVRECLPDWSDRPEVLRQYRNALLHQNRGTVDERKAMPRLVWKEPGAQGVFHGVTMNHNGQRATYIDVEIFCRDMTAAARSWLGRNYKNPVVKKNLAASIRRHPGGLFPFVKDFPVIA